jgi:O-methyltransferase
MMIDNTLDGDLDAGQRESDSGSRIAPGSVASDYLDLLKGALTATVHQSVYVARPAYSGTARRVRNWPLDAMTRALRSRDLELVRTCPRPAHIEGRVWPLTGETMVGLARLEHLQTCIEQIVRSGVPGDLIETGTWRGGASIFMRGVLRALEVLDRRVWVADSFRGLPTPDGRYVADASDEHHRHSELAVALEDVQENFRRYGLLDDQVRFLEGWFKETLPTVSDVSWSLLRLDGDMYASTMDALENLYPQLSPGGYVVVDDGALAPCRQAVDDFRARNAIDDPIEWIDWTGFFWRRSDGLSLRRSTTQA